MHDVKYRLFSAQQSRELDRIAIAEYGYTGLALMKTAGKKAFSNIMKRYSDVHSIIVMCGPGNNGGDGYVVANCAHSIGLDVVVVQAGKTKTTESVQVCREFTNNGGRIQNDLPEQIPDSGLIIDGLLGTGLDQAPVGRYADMIRAVNQCACPVVALDIPSGLHSDTGYAFDPCIEAAMTVTFIGQKFGLFTAQGRNCCGVIEYESLELPAELYDSIDPAGRIINNPEYRERVPDSHKGDYGNVVIAGGDQGMLGATLLAGLSALRCGSGLVTILSTSSHMDMPALHSPELMSQCIENTPGLNRLCDRSDVIVLGPGLGQSDWSKKVFNTALDLHKPMVVDADALTMLAREPVKRDNWVLTPHPGEAARLLGCSTMEIQQDRLKSVIAITRKYGGVCVLKGAGTLVADESRKVQVSDNGNSGMATAGMGDVLSGIIGSLMGQNLSNFEAAKTGVWLHGACADKKASEIGMASLLASDILEMLPAEILSLT
jgi:NAD(P)H-hydrate epimerase